MQRILFYAASSIVNQLNASQGFDTMERIVVVCILGYKRLKGLREHHTRVTLCDSGTGQPLTDRLQIHLYELP